MTGRRVAASWAVLLGLTLACRSKPAEPNVASLIADLTSPNSEVSGKANLALIRLGEPAVPALIELLRSEDVRIRTLAATTFWGLGEKGRAAVPVLAEAMSGDAEISVRVTAAMALGNMGAAAQEAVPALIRALKDQDSQVRNWAATALGSIGPGAESAVPALKRAARIEGSRPAAEEAIRKIRGISTDQPLPPDEPVPEN